MVYRLIAATPLRTRSSHSNARKAKLFASLIDDGNAFVSALTADDIRGLLT